MKGIDFLVRAYTALIRNSSENNSLLVIKGPDYGYLQHIRSMSISSSLRGKILFAGPLRGRDKAEVFKDDYLVGRIDDTSCLFFL